MARDSSGQGVRDAEPDRDEVGGQIALDRALLVLIDTTELERAKLDAGLEELRAEHGACVYSRLLFLLCHLRFEPEEAELRWLELSEHRQKLEERWGAPVDVRVALASFFIHVDRRLESPTIIEMQLLEQTRAFAYRDELTGLRNFRFFELYLFHELQRSKQYSWPLSLILIDLDDFKEYNDRHGHSAGNQALAEVGRLIASACRRVDVSARFGGEEFAIIAPATPKLGAEQISERVRQAIAARDWEGADSLTVSVGVATFPGDASDAGQLIRRADEALYEAKAKGKNQVRLYGDSSRSHRRVPVQLSGELHAPAMESQRVTTVDVSEGGLRFLCETELPHETLVDLKLELPGVDQTITVAGRVVQSIRDPAVRGAAIRVVDLSASDRRLLAAYLDEMAKTATD